MVEHRIEDDVAEAFEGMNRLEGVYVVPSGEILRVFTVIDDDDEATYDLIYDRERSLIRRYGGVHFDFNVIARRGRPIAEIVGSTIPIVAAE